MSTENQFNSSGFGNIDPLDHDYTKKLLQNGVPNNQTSNLILSHDNSDLFQDKKAYNYEKSIEVLYANYNVASAGNFNKNAKRQNNKADIKYSDVIILCSIDGDLANKIIDAVNRGTVYAIEDMMPIKLRKIVRVGGLKIEDKLKIGEETNFLKVKFTYFEQNQRTGLMYFRFEYEHMRQTIFCFDEFGVSCGVNVSETRLFDDAPGMLIGS
jgi:hypothetical protein